MMKIRLYRRVFCTVIDDEDFEFLSRFRWTARKHHRTWYVLTSINGKQITMQNLLINDIPIGYTVDHIDNNGLNNQKSNLRIANIFQQNANRRKLGNYTSKYKGVSLDKRGTWQATIKVNHKTIHLGGFNNEIQAARAYNKAAREHFGEFAQLNEFQLEELS